MYSEYQGKAFLREYLSVREDYCQKKGVNQTLIPNFLFEKKAVGTTQEKLQEILQLTFVEDYRKADFDIYLKAFEVRKRIHNAYEVGTIKPVDNEAFDDYDNYLLLAWCCIFFYRHFSCLKYLNTLLKVDDTLISLYSFLSNQQKEVLSDIISSELEFIRFLIEDKGIENL